MRDRRASEGSSGESSTCSRRRTGIRAREDHRRHGSHGGTAPRRPHRVGPQDRSRLHRSRLPLARHRPTRPQPRPASRRRGPRRSPVPARRRRCGYRCDRRGHGVVRRDDRHRRVRVHRPHRGPAVRTGDPRRRRLTRLPVDRGDRARHGVLRPRHADRRCDPEQGRIAATFGRGDPRTRTDRHPGARGARSRRRRHRPLAPSRSGARRGTR